MTKEERAIKSREWSRTYRERNRTVINKRHRLRSKLPENREKNRIRNLEYRRKNPDHVKKRRRAYYAANSERLIELSKKYQSQNRDFKLARRRQLRQLNREKENARTKEWKKLNADKVRAYYRERRRFKMLTDEAYSIRERLRTRIRQAVKDRFGIKAYRSSELLGCSIPDFRIYIESKFEPGMDWDNWGHGKDKWNLDHIVPCSLFDLTKPAHQKRCFHFSNYQPMWQVENFKKHYHSDGQFLLI